jgi:hypothetical protein
MYFSYKEPKKQDRKNASMPKFLVNRFGEETMRKVMGLSATPKRKPKKC